MTDFSNEAHMIQSSIAEAAGIIQQSVTAPHVLMKPNLMADGDTWIALYGDDLASGVVGCGKTPSEACAAFDAEWLSGLTPMAMYASRKENNAA